MELFRLFGSVLIDDKEAIDSLRKVDNKGKDSGSKLSNIAKKGALIGTAVVGAAAAAGGALYGMASKAAESTDRIDKLSQRLGMSREGFQEWDYILSQAGVSIDSMQNGMKTMSQRMDDVVDGSGAGVEIFEKLGVAVMDASGQVRNQEDVFEDSIMALQGMEDGIEKASLAQELFGRNGQDLLPLLNSESAGVDELKAKAHELGLVMGDDAVDAGVQFTDTMDSLKRSFGAMGTEVGVAVMPIIQKLAEWIIEHMPEIKAAVQTVFDVFSRVFGIFQRIFNWVKPYLPAMAKVVSSVFNGVVRVVDGVLDGLESLFSWIGRVKNAFKNIFSGNIKTPHFQLQGSLNPATWIKNGLPKLKIKWYADGAIFDKPTILNTPYGMKGVGDNPRSPEAVTPIHVLLDYVRQAVSEASGQFSDVIVSGNHFIVREEADIEKIARELLKQGEMKSRAVGVV